MPDLISLPGLRSGGIQRLKTNVTGFRVVGQFESGLCPMINLIVPGATCSLMPPSTLKPILESASCKIPVAYGVVSLLWTCITKPIGGVSNTPWLAPVVCHPEALKILSSSSAKANASASPHKATISTRHLSVFWSVATNCSRCFIVNVRGRSRSRNSAKALSASAWCLRASATSICVLQVFAFPDICFCDRLF